MGRPDGTSGQGEWHVEPELPTPPRREPVETEYRQTVRSALADGQPRSRVEPDERAARLVGRRLRHAAGGLNARLSLRFTPDPGGVKITFTAEQRKG